MGKYRFLFCLLLVLGVFLSTGRKEPANVAKPTQPVETAASAPTERKKAAFPFVLRDTGLIAERLVSYEGPFPADDEPVADTAALMVYNPGKEAVLSALISVARGEDILYFFLTDLPPGSRVLVVEKDKKPFPREEVVDCDCLLLERGKLERSQYVTVSETEQGLRVENRSKEPRAVMIRYKSYYAPDRFYLGGITRSVVLEPLAPGETREILPPHYAPGYSKVVSVKDL